MILTALIVVSECYVKTNKGRYVYLENHSTRNKTVLNEEQRDKLINFERKSIFFIMKKSLHIYSTCGK